MTGTVDELRAALQQLHELAVTLGVEISGCGECGSPWICWRDDGDMRPSLEHVSIGAEDDPKVRGRVNT